MSLSNAEEKSVIEFKTNETNFKNKRGVEDAEKSFYYSR